ncbi:MAG TPA: hypothetical protein EYM49_04505 [Campylobacterales bacterium]|nr:hypothetical protein [Campylobacterales bacterium]
MKKIITIGSILLMSQSLMAFESGQLSLDTPNVLKKNQGSFNIRHRFFGEIDDAEKFLGMDDGGNMYLALKYAVADNLLVGVDHTRAENAYGIGLEYAHDFKWIKAGVRVTGFRLNNANFEDTQKSYMLNGSLQTPNYFDHLNFTANVGYDAFYEHQILGFGVDLNVNNFMPFLTFTEQVSLLAEYYPQVDKIEGVSGKNDAYSFGVKFQTYGHHFEILASNSSSMDARTMSLGTDSDDLHFGFNINRKF